MGGGLLDEVTQHFKMSKVQGLSTVTEKKKQLQSVIVPKTNMSTVKVGPLTEIKKVTRFKFCSC